MKPRKIAACALLLSFAAAFIAFPQKYVPVCLEGFTVWAESVLPSLFPFMVVSSALIACGFAETAARPFARACGAVGLPKEAMPLFLMSACSGYPAGSRILGEYYGRGAISKEDCLILAPLCSTAGPLFIIGTVGFKAFGGGSAGAKLIFACLFSVISTTLVFSLFRRKRKTALPERRAANNGGTLYDSFYGAVTAVCLAGGYIAFFYTLARVMRDFGIFKPLVYALGPIFGTEAAEALSIGLCEATGGCFALAKAGGFFALPLAGFLITFGGASIIAQQAGYLNKCGVSTGYFILFKFVQAAVCFAVLCVISIV